MRFRIALACILVLVPAVSFSDDHGEELFEDRCASCHGAAALGDGPISSLLSVPVPNLTELSKRNDGKFPLRRVVDTLSGRSLPTGHGGPMPVYGDLLDGASVAIRDPEGTDIQTRAPIAALVAYLETIQN